MLGHAAHEGPDGSVEAKQGNESDCCGEIQNEHGPTRLGDGRFNEMIDAYLGHHRSMLARIALL